MVNIFVIGKLLSHMRTRRTPKENVMALLQVSSFICDSLVFVSSKILVPVKS